MMNSPTSVLSVRVSPDEPAILEAAADQARTTLSDFVRRKALDAAEAEIFERTVVTIPAKDWERFEEWVVRPATTIPELESLGRIVPTWDR